ncbi:MAG: carbon-nitrogen hydrolase family protein [Myxococcales bacterium FL481]|nr:MAG: carbon-nitrogen hydrolase family protein [Myxococcales bacterium FL481]
MPKIALITESFFGAHARARLADRLEQARGAGVTLAVLPELGLDAWVATRSEPRDEDAEDEAGPRATMCARLAQAHGVAMITTVILRDGTGRRFNTALAFDAHGELRHSYRKIHLPHEPGFWEANHYEAGEQPPRVFELAGLRVGLQICSDLNRPFGCHLLGAQRVDVIVAPRATPPSTYPRWQTVMRANAVTSGAYLVSVNRAPEDGALLGGPSLAIRPDGETVLETQEPLATVDLDPQAVQQARREYPGYLSIPSEVYARGWQGVASRPRVDS